MEGKKTILVVSHNRRNLQLLVQFLEKAGYQTRGVNSLEELDQSLEKKETIDLALLDLAGFDRSIWERCERLRTANISFLVISPKQSAIVQQSSLAAGARGVLVKPLVVKELLGLIRSLTGEN